MPSPQNETLFGNSLFKGNQVKMSYYGGSNPVRLVSLQKGDIWTHTNAHTGTGKSCEHKDRDQVKYLQAKEHQKLLADHHELGERQGTDSSSQPL